MIGRAAPAPRPSATYRRAPTAQLRLASGRLAPAGRFRSRLSTGGVAGLLLVTLLVATALVGPLAISADPDQQQLRDRLLPPVFAGGTWSHPLGTDQLGRDLLARIVAGARVSLTVGLTATAIATVTRWPLAL